jgi:hypothetical protein
MLVRKEEGQAQKRCGKKNRREKEQDLVCGSRWLYPQEDAGRRRVNCSTSFVGS